MLLVLEVVEGKLAGERFEIGQDGVDIIRKPTGKFFCFFFPKKNGVDIIRKPTGIRFAPICEEEERTGRRLMCSVEPTGDFHFFLPCEKKFKNNGQGGV